MALITNENVAELVQMYFQMHQPSYITSFKEKCKQIYERQCSGKLKMIDMYHIFWAIRVLSETGKYDHDDIEFHMRKNPIFAEIPTNDNEDVDLAADNEERKSNKPRQVGLLRQAIREYKNLLSGQIKLVNLEAKL